MTHYPLDQHQKRERLRARDKASALASLPLPDRREARAEYASLLRNTEHLATIADYILAGHYGEGVYLVALDVVANPRLNQAAGLAMLVAAHECGCPARDARLAYHSLTDDEQEAADTVLLTAIREAREALEGAP